MRTIKEYLYNSWIQTCGVGWTPKQIFLGYLFSLILPAIILISIHFSSVELTWIQMAVIGVLAWDLFGGVIGYNHHAMKQRRAGETSNIPIWHHNLLHLHPLIIIFFNNQIWLLGVTIFWFISFFLYVEFLEVDPATNKRRLGEVGQKWIVGLESAVAMALIIISFWVNGVSAEHQLFGISIYAGLIISILIITRTPVAFQQTTGAITMICMITISMFLEQPPGLQWLIPVYYLKLLVGFTPKQPMKFVAEYKSDI